MQQHTVKWRSAYKGDAPQKTKMQIPGWSGNPGYRDGDPAMPWHCKPFIDGATYGLELVYPFENECWIVGKEDGTISCEAEFTEEEKKSGVQIPPFSSFAPFHYGFTSLLDIRTDPGSIMRIEPHPRFFTDRTDTVPIAVPGHLETDWWSRIFFVVFKAPAAGNLHIFRKGEPYAQIFILPREVSYDVQPMDHQEKARRAVRDECIVRFGKSIKTHSFSDNQGHTFDNKYKVLSRAYARDGDKGIEEVFRKSQEDNRRKVKKIAKMQVRKHETTETQQETTPIGLHAVLDGTPTGSGRPKTCPAGHSFETISICPPEGGTDRICPENQ